MNCWEGFCRWCGAELEDLELEVPDRSVLVLNLLRRLVKAGTINRIGDAICNEDEHDLFILTPAEQYLLRTIEED